MPVSPQRASHAAREDGSGSVLVLAVCVVALVMNFVVAALVGAATAARRAHSAADFGALAGAQNLLDATRTGRPVDPCGRARRTVRANGGVLERCRLVGDDVVVEASVRAGGAGSLEGIWSMDLLVGSATARAGPPAPPTRRPALED